MMKLFQTTRRQTRYVRSLVWLLIIPGVTQSAVASPTRHVVAPNTTRAAFEAAAQCVVKLYGGGIGREHGYGTGFLISADGQIVTMQTLLVAGRNLRAVTADGRTYDATVVRCDDSRKLCLLKIDGENLPYLTFNSSTNLLPGDTVIALGNWFKVAEGQEPVSVNRGILSVRTYLDAKRLAQEFDYRGPALIYDAITANPGAPGGPLLDVQGRCVGIIGIVVEAAATNTRVNYAVPAEEITAFLGGDASSDESQTANVERSRGKPYLGIKLSKLGFRHVSAYIERVIPDSPAAKARLKKDDLIMTIGSARITDGDAYEAAVKDLVPGQAVQIVVKRGTELLRVELIVGERE